MIDTPVSNDNPESLWKATSAERVDTPVLESDHSVANTRDFIVTPQNR